jgi:hypothetical protein
LCITVGAAVLVITLAACGSDNNTRTDPHATTAAEIEPEITTTSPPDTVPLPDLADPATRKQFVCSFADGYFTEPQAPRDNSTSEDCG